MKGKKMERLICPNKRCKNEFYSSENKKVIKCPVCDMDVYNMEKIITTENFLFIENVIRNLQTYGEQGLMNAIDRCYPKADQRVRVRKIHMDAINKLKMD